MLSFSTNKPILPQRRPLKQGWILKKGGSGLFATWKPKYLQVIQVKGELLLQIYDNLDSIGSRPKHEIDLKSIQTEKITSRYVMLSRNAVPFCIYTRSRKV
jgi:hypothetical protein